MTFATTWMNLMSIMINEISQTEKYKYYMTSLSYGIKLKSQTHRNRQNVGCQGWSWGK